MSYFLNRSLSKNDYISMCCLVKEQVADIFPDYQHVIPVEEQCNTSKITESYCKRSFDLQIEVIVYKLLLLLFFIKL